MLCAIQLSTNQKVIARLIDKNSGPYHCPKCGETLNLRKGLIKSHHFAHMPASACSYGRGESESHRKAKGSIYDALNELEDAEHVEMEKDWGDVISDVYAVINGRRVAFEVQISTLTMECIIRRTKAYAALGIAVLWLPLFTSKLSSPKYAPAAWEKWLHATYFGRVYYWLDGLTVIPVRFASYEIAVEEKIVYDQYGDEKNVGGYNKSSKRWRKPVVMSPIKIPYDFVLRPRKSWRGGSIIVPECAILIDKQIAKKKPLKQRG